MGVWDAQSSRRQLAWRRRGHGDVRPLGMLVRRGGTAQPDRVAGFDDRCIPGRRGEWGKGPIPADMTGRCSAGDLEVGLAVEAVMDIYWICERLLYNATNLATGAICASRCASWIELFSTEHRRRGERAGRPAALATGLLVSHPFAAVIEDDAKSLRANLKTRQKVIVRVNTCIGVWASMI